MGNQLSHVCRAEDSFIAAVGSRARRCRTARLLVQLFAAPPCRRRSLTPTNRCAAPPSRGTRRRAHPPGVLDAAPSSRRDSLLPAPHPLFPPDGASSSCAARRCSCSSRPPPASVANPGTNSSSPPSSNSSLQRPFPFFQIPCSSRSANPDLGFWRGRRRVLMEANFMHLQAMDR